jgi:hypothetical protein
MPDSLRPSITRSPFIQVVKAFSPQKTTELGILKLFNIGLTIIRIEIMEQMNRHIDFGFQKLFQWTQKLFKALQFDSPEINSTARRAIRTLAERPTLFQ